MTAVRPDVALFAPLAEWRERPPLPHTALAELRSHTERVGLTADDARLLPRMRAGAVSEHQTMRRGQALALIENLPDGGARSRPKAEPGDLRGIPVIGQGVGGVSPGTSPESAINRADRQRDRRAKTVLQPLVAFAG